VIGTMRPGVRLEHCDEGYGFRLAVFIAAHPEVVIGHGEFRSWQARIPEPDGVRWVVCATLRELLDRLAVLLPP
jgi:hypothetical protein